MGKEKLMFIGRRPDTSIYGTWTSRQPDDADHPGMEELPDDHPDVLAFVNRPTPVITDPVDELRTALITDPLLLDRIKALK